MSRVQWLRLGDINTAYFHVCLKNRQAQNQIRRLVEKDDILLQSEQEVEHEVLEFYKRL